MPRKPMVTVLIVIASLIALLVFPFATVLGYLGFYLFGLWGAVIGVVIGFFLDLVRMS